ncbi:MAG TPA: nuclear transport factor 2 family protein [Acidobacteriaceae bacterium]|jgi:hypothetical protein|nr:nuclear transport factor 2 family protein [Acidobacteriaceae bacterium]
MQTPQELLLAAYKAFNARDIDAVLLLMQTDVDWPNGMEGGRVHGHDEVRAYWTRQFATLHPHVEPVRFTAEDDRVAVDVHQIVRDLSGKILVDERIQHVYVMKDGLIERMDIRRVNEG